MEFKDVVDIPAWQRTQDAAAAVLGVPVMTIDVAGRILMLSGSMPGYAQIIENKSLVLASTRGKELKERSEPHTYQCVSGTQYAIAPVYHNGNLLCAIVAGPMRFGEDLETHAITLSKMVGVHTDELLMELKRFPLSTAQTLASAQAAVELLAKTLPEAAMFRKEATRQLASLRTLLEFSNQLGTQLDMEPLFVATIDFCVKSLGVQDAGIRYAEYHLRHSMDEDRNALRAEVERRLYAQVVGNNNLVHIPDARRDFTLNSIRHIEGLPNAIVALPLQVQGKAEGMLALYLPIGTVMEPFYQVMLGVAQRLSASLERAQSLRTAQETAVTDGLTGLFNKRYFLDALRNEVSRAKQFSRPTSLLIFDIDNFKSFNDTFGHPAGDALLRQVGALLRQDGNGINIPCRYGGEEFVIIMPEANPEHAHLRAESVRAAIAAYPFDHRQCTVSIGVVVAMRSNATPETMVKEADKALYHSKKTGKNKVSTVIIVDANLGAVPYDAPATPMQPKPTSR